MALQQVDSEFVAVQELCGRIYQGQKQCEKQRSELPVILKFDSAGGHTRDYCGSPTDL